MGVLMNIYCVPRHPGALPWSAILSGLATRGFTRPPYRAGGPFRDPANRADVLWPENWIVPETLRVSASSLPLCDFEKVEDAQVYVANAPDATITMEAHEWAFRTHSAASGLSGALALYRFREGAHFRVGVPQDFSDVIDEFPELAEQSTEPHWQGMVTELMWLHGKCVPPLDEFHGSPIHRLLQQIWPEHELLADEFL